MAVSFNYELSPRSNREGLHSIVLRITVNRKHKRIKTDVLLEKKYYNPSAKYGEWVRRTHAKYRQLNQLLTQFIEEYRNKYLSLGDDVQPEHLIGKLTQQGITLATVFDLMLEEATIQKSISNYEQKRTIYNHIIAYFGPDTLIEEISTEQAQKFQDYLLSHAGNNTVRNYLKNYHSIFKKAAKKWKLKGNPFEDIEYPKSLPVHKARLRENEIDLLRQLQPVAPTKGLIRDDKLAIDLYLISYYHAGIRGKDMYLLRVADVNFETGRISYVMSKNNKARSLPIRKEALPILLKYKREGAKPEEFFFPILDNHAPYASYITPEERGKMPFEVRKVLASKVGNTRNRINKALERLTKDLLSGKKITFHTARHSFADKARRMMKKDPRITIDAIRLLMAHSSFDTTQRYLDSLDLEGQDIAHSAIFGDNE
ncbi:hypothetical protein BWI93_27250 [Siphonobacter sp. BAB-5385]|uniref:tyrosine-type recombinase/integrase n=1 Tax=Siphonobacter sp. BAB-5385 TaxID=1864822 RepID=UPI000B9DD87E|nr:tyrosine-type recombinase/integrase [Siphonobacter sp. BAB-5385]OZI05086.1 hypothetical protein BWI93_27250 [Siphonobacter sp. BAB-5385]